MEIKVLYFDGCPHWQVAEARVHEALDRLGRSDVAVVTQPVTSGDEADARAFLGSPTILIDGHDPFAEPQAPTDLSCRVYATDEGLAGAPRVDQLVDVLEARLGG